MTQRCRYDEQVLDYVYGELSAAERADFERHLSTCASCPPQVHSFSRVHSEVRGLPRLEPSPEAMQRMTAVLMQEAAKVKPVSGPGPSNDQGSGHGKNGVSSVVPSGGKIIELRPRGLRRILTHPATGVTAVAAAALLFVMFRPPGPDTEVTAPAPAAHRTITPAPAAAPTGSVADRDAKQQAAASVATPEAVAETPAAPSEKATQGDEGRGYATPTPDRPQLAERPGELGWGSDKKGGLRAPLLKGKKRGDSLDGLFMAEAEREVAQKPRAFAVPPGAPAAASPSTPATGSTASGGEAAKKEAKPLVAMADKREEREAPAAEPGFAQPPPPPAPVQTKAPSRADSNSISSELAARSRQRAVDDLENQALAQAPSTLDSTQRGRYSAGSGGAVHSQGGPAYGNKVDEPANAGRSAAPTDDEDAPAPAKSSLGRRDTTLADEAPRQLHTVQELLARGRCAEAHAVLTRIEQGTPTLRGLAEARAQYQLRCVTSNQQQLTPTPFVPSQQAPGMPAPAPATAGPMRMPLEAQVPPKPAYRSAASNTEVRAKKAAAKPAPAKAKAADALY